MKRDLGDAEDLIGIATAAEMLGVSVGSVRRYAVLGTIPTATITPRGARFSRQFSRAAIEEVIEGLRQKLLADQQVWKARGRELEAAALARRQVWDERRRAREEARAAEAPARRQASEDRQRERGEEREKRKEEERAAKMMTALDKALARRQAREERRREQSREREMYERYKKEASAAARSLKPGDLEEYARSRRQEYDAWKKERREGSRQSFYAWKVSQGG